MGPNTRRCWWQNWKPRSPRWTKCWNEPRFARMPRSEPSCWTTTTQGSMAAGVHILGQVSLTLANTGTKQSISPSHVEVAEEDDVLSVKGGGCCP